MFLTALAGFRILGHYGDDAIGVDGEIEMRIEGRRGCTSAALSIGIGELMRRSEARRQRRAR